MGEIRRRFDQDFRDGAVRLVNETGKPIAQVARDLGVIEGTLANWGNMDRKRREAGGGGLSTDERAGLVRLRGENAGMRGRGGVLKGGLVLCVADSGTRSVS